VICELVTVAAIVFGPYPEPPRAAPLRRMCLAALIRKARREHAVIIDFRDGRTGKVIGFESRVLLVRNAGP